MQAREPRLGRLDRRVIKLHQQNARWILLEAAVLTFGRSRSGWRPFLVFRQGRKMLAVRKVSGDRWIWLPVSRERRISRNFLRLYARWVATFAATLSL